MCIRDRSYHVVYQRCCRTETLNNLSNSGNSGNTFSITLTPLAQLTCNNSPIFIANSPIVICNNDELNIPQEALDPDGDSLVYSFSSLISGGGPYLTDADLNQCFGVIPDPPCPPPFMEINYVSGFTGSQPLGNSNNPVIIDPTTGIITGSPNILGQFAVGISVSEYRDGALLSTVQREFQVTVVPCEIAPIESTVNRVICAGSDFEGYTENGEYRDTFIATNGCDSLRILNLSILSENDSTCMLITTSNLNLNLNNTFKVYPIPAKEVLNIEVTNPSLLPARLNLYSVHGQLINKLSISSELTTIPLHNLTTGIYILNIQTDDEYVSYRIIKL